MKVAVTETRISILSHECFDLLLDEAERALIEVDAREDLPDERSLNAHDGPIETLQFAIAQLVDLHPMIHHDLEGVAEKLRSVGPLAGVEHIERNPHVIHLVRMALQVFFLQYPTSGDYEADLLRTQEMPEDDSLGSTVYETYRSFWIR